MGIIPVDVVDEDDTYIYIYTYLSLSIIYIYIRYFRHVYGYMLIYETWRPPT